MNEEERSNLYIYTYSDLADDFVFAEIKYTLGDLHKLQQENQKYKEAIDNAILELANIDGNLYNSQLSDRICNLIDILKEVE